MTPVDPVARRLVGELDLEPHPEGGWFRRVWTADVTVGDGAGDRAGGSAIQYLIEGGIHTSWHRIDASEMWVHSRGAPLRMQVSDGSVIDETVTLGAEDPLVPQYVVEPNRWQLAESLGEWTLAVCVVVPGFVWEGFELAEPGWEPG